MSAFAVIYECSNNTLGVPNIFNGVMERLSHRGPDGKDIISIGNVTLGHWHFWITPEEVGEHQPLSLDGLPFKIVLDGRLDNRIEIISQLGLDTNEVGNLSDASLILISYHRWNTSCFERFVGEFALVIFDEQKNELLCARDQLGERTLFYKSNDTRFVIASEPWAVLGDSIAEPELNEITFTHFFAMRTPDDGQTFFKNVYELLPAHLMIFNPSGYTTRRYWQPDPYKKVRYKTDAEYAQHFLALLEESVRCRMRSITPVGILMSGGLDSTSVACLAARMISPETLTTISKVYNELSDCNETDYINTVKEQYGLRSIQIPMDDGWPYKDLNNWIHNPNTPIGNFYRLGKERPYKRAQDEGLRVLLTGVAGDDLYLAGQEWMADLIMEGRFRDTWAGLRALIQNKGLLNTLKAEQLRLVIRIILKRFAPFLIKLHHVKLSYPVWIRPQAAKIFKKSAWVHPELERHATLLGLMMSHNCSHEVFFASRYNLELRNPYRDRRLIEFIISIPAYMLYSDGLYKHILRLAMQGILPELIRTRTKATSILSLLLRGLKHEKNTILNNLYGKHHAWHQFVNPDGLPKDFTAFVDSVQKNDPKTFIYLLCVSYEAWYKSLFSTN